MDPFVSVDWDEFNGRTAFLSDMVKEGEVQDTHVDGVNTAYFDGSVQWVTDRDPDNPVVTAWWTSGGGAQAQRLIDCETYWEYLDRY